MDSVQPGTSRDTGPVTRKRRQLKEEEEKRREKEEMKKKVKQNMKTSFIEVDKSTGKIKIEVKPELEVEEEQNVVIVKEEVEVLMDIGDPDEEPGKMMERDVVGGAPEVHPGNLVSSQITKVSVGVGTDLRVSHFVSLEEFNKLKEEIRREKEESDKRFKALEAGFQKLKEKLVNLTMTKKDGVEVAVIGVPSGADTVLSASSASENSSKPEDDRTLSLFPEVIHVIWHKYNYSLLNKADFLKSRLVCSTWRKGIDKIENDYVDCPCQSFKQKQKRDITLINGQFLWKDGKGLEFRYDPDSGIVLDSPVQPTKLTIEDARVETSMEERAQCRRNIEEFLMKHGHVTKKFICGMLMNSPQFENKEDMQRTFSRWLNLMPNLESFEFWGQIYDRYLELDQFPNLSKLKFLNDSHWPHDLFKTAVFNNPQLNSLKVYRTENFNFKDVVLPELRELDIYHTFSFDLNLLLVSELHAPVLENLKLGTVNTLKYPGQAEAVYKVLNKFRESLQFLQIRMEINDGEVVFPAMVRLKQLVFKFDSDVFIIDRAVKDLLRIISNSCPSLENLVVAASPTRYSGDETRLGRIKRRRRVELQLFSKLKLWQALPSVKKVEWIYPFYAEPDDNFVFIRRY